MTKFYLLSEDNYRTNINKFNTWPVILGTHQETHSLYVTPAREDYAENE